MVRSFPARYPGRCGTCQRTIDAGELITKTARGYEHDQCPRDWSKCGWCGSPAPVDDLTSTTDGHPTHDTCALEAEQLTSH